MPLIRPQYPTNEELDKIRHWPADDFHGLMDYVHDLWTYSGWKQEDDVYYISTGGWSGNEDVIAAMMENIVWWLLYWQQSRRGGHYIFSEQPLRKSHDYPSPISNPLR